MTTTKLSLTVKTLDSRNHAFDDLDDSMTVKDLKIHIGPTVGIPPESQRLIYCGRVLQDDKKLSEYGVHQKVVHLVQRQPPSTGADRLAASEARARSRGSSPTPRAGQQRTHHIHVHGAPVNVGQPSMLVRLILAREMISRANAIIDALENPTSTATPAATSATTPAATSTATPPAPTPDGSATAASGSSSSSTTSASSSPTNNSAENVATNSRAFRLNLEENSGIPSSLTQVVQSALNSAMSSMVNGGGGGAGYHALSFRVGRDGQLTPTSSSNGATAAASGNRPTPGEAAAAAVAAEASSATGSPARTPNHPRPPALADVMRSYSELNRRINPFWEEVMNLLIDDQNQNQTPEVADRNQTLFLRVTEAMHFMSHALHALSDGVINYSQAPPREVRARPFLIQSMVQSMVQSVPIRVGQPRAASMGGPPATATSTSSTSSTATAAASSNSQQQRQSEIHIRPEIEVTMEPIVVGIEMGGPEITISASGGGTITRGGNLPENYLQHMIEGVLSNIMGGPPPTPASTSAAASNSSSAQSGNNPSQDSRARGNTQTQPTTSTRTRTTTHVHYAPLGQIPIAAMGPPPNANGSAFDPFLPCHSHHIRTERGRGPRAGQRVVRQQRSSSVPPIVDPAGSGNSESRSNEPQSASSARTTPLQSPARRLTATIDVNLIPLFARHQQQQQQQQQQHQQLLEPGLLNIIGQLSGAMGGASRDPGMLNVIQNVLGQVSSVLSGELSGRPAEGGQTVAQFLQALPDYSYEEGESLTTDLLMAIARVMTFRDVIGIVMGNSPSYSRLQTPLKEFLQRRVMAGETQLEIALIKLLDDNFSTLEEVSRVGNVKDDIDLAETLHHFFEERLLALGRCILDSPEDQFPNRFQTLVRTFLADLTNLCLICCTDGPASIERMVQNRLETISGDVAAAIQEWTMSSAIGHVRNFIAEHGREEDGVAVERFVIHRGSLEAVRRREAREARKMSSLENGDSSSSSADQQQQPEEIDNFVTPRSSPERMEADVPMETQDEEMPTASTSPLPPIPPAMAGDLPFPAELQFPRGSLGPDMVVGGEAWHRPLPADWVPIIARDIQRQAEQEEQTPFSDAYLTTQPSKRRRIIAADKPEGSVERVIADTLQDAISEAGVEPTTSVEQAMRDASSSVGVVESVKSETRKIAKNRLDKDPDFKQIGDSFPHSKSFARK